MPFTFKKSFLRANPDIEVQIAAHAHEVREWNEREKRVAQDAKNPNIPDIERWAPCPFPDAPNGWVASAVDKDGNADYQVENDDPTPEDLLPLRKDELVAKLRSAEAEAHNAVLASNKRPLRQMVAQDIATKDAETRNAVVAENEKAITASFDAYNAKVVEVNNAEIGLLTSLAAKMGITDDPRAAALAAIPKPDPKLLDVEAEVAARRSAEDAAVVEENAKIQASEAAINRAVAQALHDIEDLTVDTVDYYQLPDLTKQG
jgi:hypothetical protein